MSFDNNEELEEEEELDFDEWWDRLDDIERENYDRAMSGEEEDYYWEH